MSASNNRPDHSVSPELPSVPPKKPPCTNNGRSMSYTLIILGIVTAAAFITVCFRHFRFDLSMHSVIGLLSLLSFYGSPIFSPLAILSLSLYQKRNAPFSDALLLIFPLGCAIGCMLMCNAPTDNHDGEIMGLGLLTVLWGLISIPFCCISFFTKEKGN